MITREQISTINRLCNTNIVLFYPDPAGNGRYLQISRITEKVHFLNATVDSELPLDFFDPGSIMIFGLKLNLNHLVGLGA